MPSAVRKVLLVDDDERVLDLVARSLARRELEVTTATGPAVALQVAAAQQPDLAVVDLMLGPASGIELIRALKANHPDLRVVLLSGFLSVATTVAAIRAGADAVLVKPVTASEILASLDDDAPPQAEPEDMPPTLARIEWEHIARVMADCQGNVSMAARRLGVSRTTLQRRLRKAPPTR